ncbi:hypothetical protein Q9L58_010674 [Maublancomyces gigas]|uniref:Alpha/beta hydrolase n=1 Tax=Discina gigas TaxID=1032678 RepID=A0ABR3G3E9_9PEZI
MFVHGYNVTFNEAAIRAGQLSYDLKIQNAAFFSWPSLGKISAYPADEVSVANAEPHLMEFLLHFDRIAFLQQRPLHIIAHSMGNRLLLRALQRINDKGMVLRSLSRIVFAAPDEDKDIFERMVNELSGVGSGKTLYATSKDLALAASGALHGAPRAGTLPPAALAPGLDTIDAAGVDQTFMGHGDFASQRPLLGDMFTWLSQGTPPNQRASLKPVIDTNGNYWRIT